MEPKKSSSSLKVGILTLSAIFILIFTVLWIKGRSLSAGERIDVIFKDINGMRAGSGVQMMGLRIGQVEEITPIINGKDSYIKLRFVITEKDVEIPPASRISIQQSGLIGEQFLEITPPEIQTVFVETIKSTTAIEKGQEIYMELSGSLHKIGNVDECIVLPTSQIPFDLKNKIKTKYTLRIKYTITLPGLVLDNDEISAKIINNQLIFYMLDGEKLYAPNQNLKYTVIEPMRISDFMEINYKASKSLNETNEKISEILSDEMVGELRESIKNINELTANASTTLDKAQLLLDSSKKELEDVLAQSNKLISKLIILTDSLNEITNDDELKNSIVQTTKSVGELSKNVNTLLEDKKTKEIITNLDEISRNLADISSYMNEFTKDDKLKNDISSTVSNINKISANINKTLNNLNNLDSCQKASVDNIISDTVITSRNLRKFSEKLNKRFLLFRLMF